MLPASTMLELRTKADAVTIKPSTMVDHLIKYFNDTRSISALYPEDDPRLEELARDAFERLPAACEELELGIEDEDMLRKLGAYNVLIYGGLSCHM